MLGPLRRQLGRHLRRGFRALGPRRTRRWRLRLREWAGANVKAVLRSEKGEARLDQIVTELARRLAPVLSRLDEGAAVLDDSGFATSFQHALSWIAYQEDVTGRGATLRAYCDITASRAVLNLLVREIAAELSPADLDGEMHVAQRLAAAAGTWREPLIVAGRPRLAAGRYDDAPARPN